MTNRQDDPCGPGKFLAPTRSINIRTEIPGPKSRALSERYQAHTGAQPEIVIASAHGARMIDVDNNVYIDFASGTAVGHTHERVVAAVQRQVEVADSLPPNAWQQNYDVHLQLTELLGAICPLPAPKQIALTSPDAAKRFLHLVREQMIVIRCDDGIMTPFPEPVHGAIIDETQIGIGRTGRLFAFEHFNIQPAAVAIKITDDVCAVIADSAVLPEPLHSSRINPVAAAAALETLNIILDQRLATRAMQISDIVGERLDQLTSKNPLIIHRRGIGALHAFYLHRRSHWDFVTLARDNGLLLTTHAMGEYIPLLYPLMIPEEQLHEGLDMLQYLLEDVH
ncbi:MAG: aminotransferase class III-fold pyridoxal phosphate-dependent enzyme [Anaerolineae bacterium]|nr:aminotransferase class III-fold pyridoxal phosphate-dependent enzyme [Anaerolineae bacterium]